MNDRPVVMISSTARDLPEHRKEVLAACQSHDFVPKMMEYLPAGDANAIQASLALVNEADLYIGVFAFRYGQHFFQCAFYSNLFSRSYSRRWVGF